MPVSGDLEGNLAKKEQNPGCDELSIVRGQTQNDGGRDIASPISYSASFSLPYMRAMGEMTPWGRAVLQVVALARRVGLARDATRIGVSRFQTPVLALCLSSVVQVAY